MFRFRFKSVLWLVLFSLVIVGSGLGGITQVSADTNVFLSDLRISGGSLSPAFNRSINDYNFSTDASSITVTAVPENGSATVIVAGQILSASNGWASQPISLYADVSQLEVRVFADFGAINSYYIGITRSPYASSAYLSSLSIGGATLNPAFNREQLTYTASTSQTSVTITAVPEYAGATVKVEGQTVNPGSPSQPIYLSSGVINRIDIQVYNPLYYTYKNYWIDVTLGPATGSAYLSSLSISGATLSPSFSKQQLEYSASTSQTSVTVTAVPENTYATVTVEGQRLSGPNYVSQAIYLSSGTTNRIDIQVYNPANGEYNNYWIDVTLGQAIGGAYLSSLNLSASSLSPSFYRTTTAYTAYTSQSSVTVTAVPENTYATVKVEGQLLSSPNYVSQPIYLSSGTTNRIDIQVYNPANGDYKDYWIDVYLGYNYNYNNVFLSNLYLTGISLDQYFYRSTNSYTARTTQSTTTVVAIPEDSNASVWVEGQRVYGYNWESQPVYLYNGTNRIDIQVYSPSNSTYNNYYIDVTLNGSSGSGYVSTDAASDIGSSSATLNARINYSNYRNVEWYGFAYSTNQSNWQLVTVAGGNHTGVYSKVLKNLQPNTTYYYKAFIYNSYDYYTYGSVTSFYTRNSGGTVEPPVFNPRSPSGSFWDVPGSHWAYSHISSIVQRGYMTGYADSSFKPGNGITRAEVASVMAKILNLSSYDSSVRHFYDVNTKDWFFQAVEKAYQRGIISGQGGYFNPNQAVTREELAEVLVKSLGRQSEAQASMYEDTGFHDDGSISPSARGYVVTAVNYGLITGSNNYFYPRSNVSRAEVCAMLNTFLSRYR